jgi:hypothetical protein
MVPSEAEIRARLADLRRRREALDREIADHLLYLELGRRLRASPQTDGRADAVVDAPADGARDPSPDPSPDPWPDPWPPSGAEPPAGPGHPARDPAPTMPGAPAPPGPRAWAAPWAAPAARPQGVAGRAPGDAMAPRAPAPVPSPIPSSGASSGASPPPAVPFEEDPAATRRYGRALVEAALAVLTEANRPMHAGEILEHLAARGFAVPGQDPVAALNTRLWKRSGPGGPLRRLGDAVYDRADGPGSAPSFGLPDLR